VDSKHNNGRYLYLRNIEMKILVTGGFGLIGHNVVKILLTQGHQVMIVDNQTSYGIIPRPELDYLMSERMAKIRGLPYNFIGQDINDAERTDGIFTAFKPDTVIHMASFPRQKVVNANPQLGSRTMSEGLLNLLESSVKHGVTRFTYISSSMVYGDFKDDVKEDYNCRPQGQYGILKLAGEWLVKDYTRKHGIAHTIIRPSAVYGPLDVEDRVISKFMLAALRGQTLKVNGASETLDFTYVDDAAEGIAKASVCVRAQNKTYNITKSHSWSLLDAANLAVSIAGRGQVEVRDRDLDFPSRGALNIDAARTDFGFDPQVDVEEGFRRYHQWFLQSPYWSQRL
jgi:UDP-glucuronate 4-epimerase